MKKYIGTKEISAEPMHEISAANKGLARPNDDNHPWRDGYHVQYTNPDGTVYDSWSPKDVFEQSYRVADTYLDRLRIERDELHDRYVKAKNYLSSPLAEKQLTPREKGSLAAQVEFMRQYLFCVEERIKYAMEKLNDKKDISE